MRRELIFTFIICLTSLVSTKIYADPIPEEVLAPYQASRTEMKNKNIKAAAKHAKIAWEKAEELLGDSETTASLAYNYGYLAFSLKQNKPAVKAMERSANLTAVTDKKTGLLRLQREESLAVLLVVMNKRSKANLRLNEVLNIAEEYNIDDTLMAAKLFLHKARVVASSANSKAKNTTNLSVTRIDTAGRRSPANRMQWRSAQFAEKALEIFAQHPEAKIDEYRALSHKLVGFSHERDKDWLEATLAYQRAIGIQTTYLQFEDQALLTTVGRWSNARMHLLSELGEDEAISKGLSKNWPIDKKDRKNQVEYIAKPVKRVPPVMPSRATTSGFSFMQFDLDDAGKPINIKAVHSWPKKMFEKSSIRAVKKWQYTPRVAEETDEQRKGLRTTITYILSGSYGGDPI